jgi:hypothetical protein
VATGGTGGRGGWVSPTARRSQPGAAGGRPAELFRAGRAWRRGAPIQRASRVLERK